MKDHKSEKHILSELEYADRMIRATSVILFRVRVDIKRLLPIEFVSENISVHGYSAKEIMSRQMSYTDLMHPDDVASCGEKLLDFLREGKQEYMLEYRIVTADKQVRWVEDRLLIEWDEDSGRATHIQGILLDITDRKEAENALADSLAKAEAQTRHLRALNQLSQDLMQATNKLTVFSALRKYTTDIVEADRISLTLTSEDETMLDIIELSGDKSQAAIVGTQIPIKGSIAGDVYQQKKPIATNNLTANRLHQLGIRSTLCVPLIFGDQVMGTINIGRFNPDQYDEGEVELLVQIASLIASVLANQELAKRLETANKIIQINPVILIKSQMRDDIDRPTLFASDGVTRLRYTPVHDVAWPTLFVSDGVTQLGYTPDELVSGNVIFLDEIVHPEDKDRLVKTVSDYLASGTDEFTIDYRVLTRDGEVRWISDLLTCERDEQGRFTYCHELLLDVTEHKLAQNMLEITQHSIDSASNPIAWMGKDGRFVYANDALCQHFGYTKEQLLTMYSYNFRPEFSGEGWGQFWEKMKLEKVYTAESIHVSREGKEIPVEITENYHKIGEDEYVFAFVQNITERKKAAEALTASKKNLELILDKLPVPVCLVELATGQPIYVNEAYCHLYRGSQKDVLARNSKRAYKNPKDRENLLLSRLKKDGVVRQQEIEFVRMDGSSFWGSVSTHIIHEGKSTISTVFDLTERIKNEKELESARDAAEAANKAKNEFLSNMSHELRTPLNGILGYTQLLQRDNTIVDTHRQYIDVIHQSGEYLLMLINGILDIAKIEARKLELHEMPIHTYSFLKGIADIVALQLLEKKIELIVDIAADLPRGIVADQVRLQQVLLNLLGNAIKFTEQGEITLHVSLSELNEQSVHILFEVNDTGVGIRPEQLKRIFQAFEQVGDKNARAAGTGLGLAISQQLVKMMGGEIVVSSSVGQGSCFSFGLTFELTSDAIATPEHSLEYRIGYEGERKTVLVVDDNQVNRSFLNNLLTNRGFVIVEAENGRDALKQLDIHPFDLIITDLVMPEMNGYDLSRAVKENPSIQHIPMIAVSASTEDQSGHKALDAGCDAFLPKPVFVPHLLDEIGNRFQLTWIHEEGKTVSNGDEGIDTNTNPAHFLRPASLHINALIEIVELGDMLGAIKYVEQLADNDEQLTAFCRYVHQLAADFEDEELLNFLEAS